MDFEKLPRFKIDQLAILCEIERWVDVFEVERSEIERQIKFAHGWIDANPRKAPRTNVIRYLFNWLTIAERKGSLLRKPRENFKEVVAESDIMTGEDFARMREALRGGARTGSCRPVKGT